MGFETTQFHDPVEEEFVCAICMEVFSDPMEVPCCRNVLCQSCLESWVSRSGVCAFCREHIVRANCKPAHPIICAILNRKRIKCTNHAKGCTAICRLGDLARHDKEECPLRAVPCRFQCGESPPMRDKAEHESRCCKNIDVQDITKEWGEIKSRLDGLHQRINLLPIHLRGNTNPSSGASPVDMTRSQFLSVSAVTDLREGVLFQYQPTGQTMSMARDLVAESALGGLPQSQPQSQSQPNSQPQPQSQLQSQSQPTLPAPNVCSHRWVRDVCRICVECLQCTEYGRSCVCQRDNPNRRVQAKDLCGCGAGVSGCSHCHLCWRCAGLSRAPSVR
eukprot:TRINITY_DN585_c0_g5_i1.p1 TRINITY_DN585_c0_g5~~TRINITY_DN585_c0_g5_i1.p1  ORF type:complete len:333 (+),score=24.72 TRINITY_DN585_c0_g5_i1:50-1048(+)